jgi:hypothetical protein
LFLLGVPPSHLAEQFLPTTRNQFFCNQQVVGSNPTAGSMDFRLSVADLRLRASEAVTLD